MKKMASMLVTMAAQRVRGSLCRADMVTARRLAAWLAGWLAAAGWWRWVLLTCEGVVFVCRHWEARHDDVRVECALPALLPGSVAGQHSSNTRASESYCELAVLFLDELRPQRRYLGVHCSGWLGLATSCPLTGVRVHEVLQRHEALIHVGAPVLALVSLLLTAQHSHNSHSLSSSLGEESNAGAGETSSVDTSARLVSTTRG